MQMRLIGAAMVLGLLAVVSLAFAQFDNVFTETDEVTLTAPRAGLVLDSDAKVKLRGVQIGKVARVEHDGQQATLVLALDRGTLDLVPADVKVDIASTTVFGAKFVNFVVPEKPSSQRLAPGATLSADAVTVEFNTLFQHLTQVLAQIDPVKLNATLDAVATAVHGRGAAIGDLITRGESYLRTMNPTLPTLRRDMSATADVANLYASSAADLLRLLSNTTTTSDTVVAQQTDLAAVLVGLNTLSGTASGVLTDNRRNLGTSLDQFRKLTNVLSLYSPAMNCMIVGLDKLQPLAEAMEGGDNEGLTLNSGLIPAMPAFHYPQDLPKVNAKGGPRCQGLPDAALDPRAPKPKYLVTDTATVPFAPSSEVRVAPETLFGFLFHGVYPTGGGR